MSRYPIVILAGGLATRLHPITEKIPKALVEVGGKPFIYHQLRLLQSQGFQHIIILVWYRGDMIRDYVGDGSQFGLNVDFIFDGERPLGTAGATRMALNLIDGPFFVLYGDSYLPCDYADIQAYFNKGKPPALMTVYRNLGKWGTSNVEMTAGQILSYDKKQSTPRMEFIDYGLGLFKAEVFKSLPENQPADLEGIYQELISDQHLLAYEVKERFYEIGSFEGLKELNGYLASDPDQFLRRDKP